MSAGFKTVAIVQARMTSTRLPGKVLLPILGQPLLALQIERMRRALLVDLIVIATTTNASDEPIVDFCKRCKGRRSAVMKSTWGTRRVHCRFCE